MAGVLARAASGLHRLGAAVGDLAAAAGDAIPRSRRWRRALSNGLQADVPVDIGCIEVFRAESFPESGPSPWLDQPDAPAIIERRLARGEIDAEQARVCRFWNEHGYYIARGAIDHDTIDRAWAAYEAAAKRGRITLAPEGMSESDPYPGRYLNPHLKVRRLDRLLRHPVLVNFSSMVLGRPAIPFQTIAFHKGSQQSEHSDSIHMTTYPLGYLAACWVAMEDIHPDSGPLLFYPGSHRLPYVFSHDVGLTREAFQARGYDAYAEHYEAAIKRDLVARGAEPVPFLARKGDVLFWHANLLHGGSARNDLRHSRKSLVHHYFAEGCICYHDLVASPSAVHGSARNLPICGAANSDGPVRRRVSRRRAA